MFTLLLLLLLCRYIITLMVRLSMRSSNNDMLLKRLSCIGTSKSMFKASRSFMTQNHVTSIEPNHNDHVTISSFNSETRCQKDLKKVVLDTVFARIHKKYSQKNQQRLSSASRRRSAEALDMTVLRGAA